MTLLVAASAVREYLNLNSTPSTQQYSDATIASNILAAQSMLERATSRWFVDRPATTYTATSLNRASFLLPGFRTVTGATRDGTDLTVAVDGGTGTFYLIRDALQTGVYTGLALRPYNSYRPGPWWLSDPSWFDRNLDSPWFPGNYGGANYRTSIPNDIVVSGDGGYATDSVPDAALHAIKVLAAFYTMRPASLLADVAITPAGGVVNYSQIPGEVQTFIAQWQIGEQWASLG